MPPLQTDPERSRLHLVPAPQRRVVRLVRRGFVPVESDLRAPQLAEGLVPRRRLLDRLAAEQPPVVLVTGPPGYGKTTLLAQWDEQDDRPFAWLSVSAEANDPLVLVTYLVLAMHDLGVPDQGVLAAVADGADVSTVVLPRLGRALAQEHRPLVLVVDDAGSLATPGALEVLTSVARHLNHGSQLALAARTLPDLPWGLLRAERRLLPLDADDLRLRHDETDEVLAAAGAALREEEVDALLERTEGWPAAVHLAALELARTVRPGRAVAGVCGPRSLLGGHLRHELRTGVAPALRRFLLRTSLLDELTGPLCDAVLDAAGSGLALAELERRSLFLVRVEGDGGRYRYHRLFREVLLDELASEEEPRVLAALHARASRLLEAEGDPGAAVRHALAAGDLRRAVDLLWSHTGTCVASGQEAAVGSWLDAFTDEELATQPRLALARAWWAVESGHAADRWVAAAEQSGDAGQDHEVEAALALLRARRARGGVAQLAADAERAARLQRPDDPWGVLAQYLRAVALLLGGQGDQARDLLEATAPVAASLRMQSHQARCLAQLAVLALHEGDWDTAAAWADEATELLSANRVPETVTLGLVPSAEALLLAKEGSTDRARRVAARARAAVALLEECPPWLAVETRYLLARAHLLVGDTAAARVLLSEAQVLLPDSPGASWLEERVAEAWEHVQHRPLSDSVGPSTLTAAELRVLQLLPTHLSFAQIGGRLSVSRNTVKTQAIATYRKLGVSSRGEAVARATSLGLLQA